MGLKFHTAMAIFASVICFFVFIYLLRLFFVKGEGFEDIKKNVKEGDINSACPANTVTVMQILGKDNNLACYPEGLTNVDRLFMNNNQMVYVLAKSDKTAVTLYSDIDGKGDKTVATFFKQQLDRDYVRYIFTSPKFKFKSIRVILDVNNPKQQPESKGDSGSCNSKPLSPAAQAAADAADAAAAAAADAAAKAVGVTPGVKDPYVSATPSVFSVTCPSGDPIVAFGATKPPSLDSQLGKFGGPGVKRRVYKKTDFSDEDDEDKDDLEGADPKNECHTADSQPADVESSCVLKPVVPCGRNRYTFDPETEY
jgi:hypothetical protein